MKANEVESVLVERLAVSRGVALTKKGAVLVGTCPLHEHGKPRLVLDPNKNTWSCSTCNVENGGPVEWIMRAEGVSKKHATAMLRSGKATLDRKNTGRKVGAVPTKTTVRAMGFAFTPTDTDAAILGGIVEFYGRALEHHEQAKSFLQERGLRHPGLAQHFKLGVADKTLGLHIPLPNRLLGRQQELLGHSETSTTAIYTRVSVGRLKIIHAQFHPGSKLSPLPPKGPIAGKQPSPEDLMEALEAESDEDEPSE